MTFSEDAWARNAPLYEAIRTMPFNEELAAGTLAPTAFEHYLVQDAHYLIGFGRALAVTAAKAPQTPLIIEFCQAATNAIVVERAMHETYFKKWGITDEQFLSEPVSPACHHYVSFLLASAYAEPYEVAAAAVLPCFWVYAEIGLDIHGRAKPNNPFEPWIDTYADDAFQTVVRGIRNAVDEAATQASDRERAAMHEAYTASMHLEFMFWDGAYHGRAWPS